MLSVKFRDQSGVGVVIIIVIVVVIIVLAAATYLLLGQSQEETTDTNDQQVEQEESNENQPNIDTATFKSDEHSYSFSYNPSWAHESSGSLVVLDNPDTDNTASAPFPGETLVSTVPYQTNEPETPSKYNQIRTLMEEITSDFSPTQANGLAGIVGTSNEGLPVLNIMLQGEKNILFVQFINVSSLEDLGADEQLILNTISET